MSRTTQTEHPRDPDGFDYEVIDGEGGGDNENAVLIGGLRERGDGKEPQHLAATSMRPFSRRTLLLVLALFALATGGVFAWLLSGRASDSSRGAYPISGVVLSGLDAGPRVGALAPDFELTDVNTGKPVRLSSLRGKPVWLNYFATWCPPCKAEMPEIKQEYAKYRDKGLVVIGIDMREEQAQVKSFTDSNGYDWTFVVDADGKVTDRYFVYGIPTHLFIDKEGVIKSVSVGGLTAEGMETNLSKIIGE